MTASAEGPVRPKTVRVQVDLTKCAGFAQCCFAAPNVFWMLSSEGLDYHGAPPVEEEALVRRAAAACPVQAITIGPPIEPASWPRKALNRAGSRVAIIGGSLAGLSAARVLSARAEATEVVIVGEEPDLPYDRPALSKSLLTGRLPPGAVDLPGADNLDVTWLTGRKAVSLDPAGGAVHLDNGEALTFDRLLITTGARARSWPDPDAAKLSGVHTLRSRNDACRLQKGLAAASGRRVIVVGGGFIGCEVASVCRRLGLDVTLVDRGVAPLANALGLAIGHRLGSLQLAHGVDLRLENEVVAVLGKGGRVHGVKLASGEEIEAALVVVALGAIRNTEWLEDSGISFDAKGVSTDAFCRVLDWEGRPFSNVFAAGDVAKWPSDLFGGELAVEHWSNAVAQGKAAAANMLAAEPDLRPADLRGPSSLLLAADSIRPGNSA